MFFANPRLGAGEFLIINHHFEKKNIIKFKPVQYVYMYLIYILYSAKICPHVAIHWSRMAFVSFPMAILPSNYFPI